MSQAKKKELGGFSMIDFTNKKIFKLSGEKVEKGEKAVSELLIPGEELVAGNNIKQLCAAISEHIL
jgi:hypothetical protein